MRNSGALRFAITRNVQDSDVIFFEPVSKFLAPIATLWIRNVKERLSQFSRNVISEPASTGAILPHEKRSVRIQNVATSSCRKTIFSAFQ